MTLLEPFYNIDLAILRFLNIDCGGPVLDQFWLVITHLERQWWFVFIVLPILLAWLVYIYRWASIKIMVAVGLAVAISDAVSYRLIKALIERPRPFMDSDLKWLRHVGDAHGASFPSNHAANTFAAAMILSWYIPRLSNVFYIFAGLVSLSRIALGVHYPSDVLGGVAVGCAVGILVRSLLLNRISWFRLHKSVAFSDENSSAWRRRFQQPSAD